MDCEVGDDDGGYYAIECAKCGDGRFCGVHSDSREESVEAWNRRTEADALAHRLAYRWARIALWRASRTLDDWMEPVLEHCNAAGREDAQEAIAYLRARGLLEQHPERPELVRVREQT